MDTIHTKGIHVCTNMDEYLFEDRIKEKEEIEWYGRVQLEDGKLKFIITIGDYIICTWSPGDKQPTFENRYDAEHRYSKIYAEWVMVCMSYNLVNTLLPKDN